METYDDDSSAGNDTVLEASIWEKIGIGAGIVMMLVCMAGIAGNLMSLAIFLGPHFRRVSINILLTALSAMDLCLLVIAFPTFVLPPVGRLYPSNLLSDLNMVGVVYLYPFTTMFQTASVWLLILVSIERWCAVKHPLSVKVIFTKRRAVHMAVATVLASVAYNFVRFWEFREDPPPRRVALKLRENKMFMLWYVNVAGILTMYVIPLSVHCVLNIQVVHAILKARNNRQRMSANEVRELKMTKSMAAVVLGKFWNLWALAGLLTNPCYVFVVCDSFAFALNIVEHFDQAIFHTAFGIFLSDTNNLLVIFNSASTWIFYLLYSTRYRQQAKKIVFSMFCPDLVDQENCRLDTQRTRRNLSCRSSTALLGGRGVSVKGKQITMSLSVTPKTAGRPRATSATNQMLFFSNPKSTTTETLM